MGSFNFKMARIRVLQQAQALYIRQNSLAVGLQRQYGLSPAVAVPRRSLKTTVSCLQQKETSEAPVETPVAPPEPAVDPEKRKHITEEIQKHNATKDTLAAEITSHTNTKG